MVQTSRGDWSERRQSCQSRPLIFDMDGVLIDSEPAHKLAKERAFARFGITLPESDYEQYMGRPDATMMNEVVPSHPSVENRCSRKCFA